MALPSNSQHMRSVLGLETGEVLPGMRPALLIDGMDLRKLRWAIPTHGAPNSTETWR